MKQPSFLIHSIRQLSVDGKSCGISGSIPSLFYVPVKTLVSSSVFGGGIAEDVVAAVVVMCNMDW